MLESRQSEAALEALGQRVVDACPLFISLITPSPPAGRLRIEYACKSFFYTSILI